MFHWSGSELTAKQLTAMLTDFFERLGLPRRFVVDAAALEREPTCPGRGPSTRTTTPAVAHGRPRG